MSDKITKTIIDKSTQEFRAELQQKKTEGLKRRRKIIGLSLLGMGAMAAVTLFQTGILKHLPDPPIDGFDSDKVNSSDTAYALGVPDGDFIAGGFCRKYSDSGFRRR